MIVILTAIAPSPVELDKMILFNNNILTWNNNQSLIER